MTQTVELPAGRKNRRYPLEWKRWIVERTLESGASVARVSRENDVNANQVWAWRKLYLQGLLGAQPGPAVQMLPVVLSESTACEEELSMKSVGAVAPHGSIQIEHGKTIIRIDGAPVPTVLGQILDRVLR